MIFGHGSSLNFDEGVHGGHLGENCIETTDISGGNNDECIELVMNT